MINGAGFIQEIYIDDKRAARLQCAPALIPAPGQYLLALANSETDAPLAHPIYQAGICPNGFYLAPPLPNLAWQPGAQLRLRGPLGNGFHLPLSARKIALLAYNHSPARLLALLEPALNQKASIVLLTSATPQDLPTSLEVLPLAAALADILLWADYVAIDISRAELKTTPLRNQLRAYIGDSAEALIETHLPCGGSANCGVCAVKTHSGWQMACANGPVFPLLSLL